MLSEFNYPITTKGLETSFVESEAPASYATVFTNRFINAAGGAEKRQGITRFGNVVPGSPTLDGIHELVQNDGSTILMYSGQGKIWRADETTGSATAIYVSADPNTKLRSVQMGDMLIFTNGVDRPFYTIDASAFTELKALMEVGTLGGPVSALGSSDLTVTNWLTDTNVNNSDLIHNLNGGGYGLITQVFATASVTVTSVNTFLKHTAIGSAASGIGFQTNDNAVGDAYEIIDLVELNVIPTQNPSNPDNTGVLASGASTTVVRVSAVTDWTKTEVRVGDYVNNTTQNALTQVTAISTAQLGVIGISGQVAGDSIQLFKSAMPIPNKAHVHYGRLFLADERDQRLIRISGASNPQDMSNNAGTLTLNTFSFGDIQPKGDAVLTMDSFLRYFVVAGESNTYMFEGNNPIADVSADASQNTIMTSTNWTLVAMFPHGVVSPDGALSIGNDFTFVTPDGVQSIALVGFGSNLNRANISEALKVTLRQLIEDTPASQIIAVHYPRRSWFLIKIGSQIYCFNYTAFIGQQNQIDQASGNFTASQGNGTWSLFDGKFAQQNAYFVRRNGDLLCAGANGLVYKFDNGTYDDDGENIETHYRSAWFSLSEPRQTVNIKQTRYIKPIVDAGAAVLYTITAEAGFDDESVDTCTVTAAGGNAIGVAVVGETAIGGTSIINNKYPLRVRGERVRISIDTDDSLGPDIISRLTLYYTSHGAR